MSPDDPATTPVGEPDPSDPGLSDLDPANLPFGPYAGQDVASVAVIDPNYLLDLVREGIGSPALRAEAARSLAARGRLGPRGTDSLVGGKVAGNTVGSTAGGLDEPLGSPPPPVSAMFGRPPPWALALALGLVGVVAALLWSERGIPGTAGEHVPIAEARAPGGLAETPAHSIGGAIARSSTATRPPAVATAAAAEPAGTPLPCGARVPGAIPAAVAGDFVDTFQAVEFEVVRTKDTGKVTFLNSHEPYQGHFYVAIFPTDYALYPEPPALYFRGKCVVVQGTIELYRGVPQMVLRSPDDVRVVEEPGGAGDVPAVKDEGSRVPP